MKKLTYKSTSKKNAKWVRINVVNVVNETPEEFLARARQMDGFSYHEALEVRDMTPAEIAQFDAENAAADYYSRHDTSLEG